MKVTPVGDRVLVRLEPLPAESDGGIVLSDWARWHHVGGTRTGVVEAVGPGWPDRHGVRHPPQLAVGDRVYLAKWHAQEGLQVILPWDQELALVSGSLDVLSVAE